MRSIPGGLLMSTRYTEFVATNDFKADPSTRAPAHTEVGHSYRIVR